MIITRFPPEPNGSLHIGHVKSIVVNFNYANESENKKCILRMDDTNPETEKQEYVDYIIKDIEWLGFKPWKITYTSDYFEDLYNYAIILIKNDKAYVDFSSKEEIKENRENKKENEYRNKSIELNLREFENMKDGKYKEHEAVLRLKIDMGHKNIIMRDPIAYTIKATPHYKTKDKWNIYPSYDYSHGIVDSIEKITYSYCTMEFRTRRDLYYWSLEQLNKLGIGMHIPIVKEYGKLKIENSILSKRNINKLIKDGLIENYDDPRLYTIRGMMRRGYSPNIINKMVY